MWASKRDRERAVKLAERARDAHERAGETKKKRVAEAEQWLKKRGLR